MSKCEHLFVKKFNNIQLFFLSDPRVDMVDNVVTGAARSVCLPALCLSLPVSTLKSFQKGVQKYFIRKI